MMRCFGRSAKGKWRVMPSPVLEGPVADTRTHLQMLADPACELARAGAHGVAFVETIVDPAEDGFATFDVLPLGSWRPRAI